MLSSAMVGAFRYAAIIIQLIFMFSFVVYPCCKLSVDALVIEVIYVLVISTATKLYCSTYIISA